MKLLDNIKTYFGWTSTAKEVSKEVTAQEPINENPSKVRVNTPAGRVSVSDDDSGYNNKVLKDWAKPAVPSESIKYIRKLARTNGDMGSVYNDLIQLTNTGYKILFDSSVPPEQVDRMRKHLSTVSANWGSGVHGIDGLINKWIGQVYISGALSTEWVPKDKLDGIQNVVLVNPEDIKFKYNSARVKYEPYQIVKNRISTNSVDNTVKLNENTYFYAGILGDTDSPYGIPPFLTALEPLKDQALMKKNINHILKQLGLLGYLELKIDKPAQDAGESVPAYYQRLETLLNTSKKNVIDGFADGVVVGYEGDHTFEFHSTTKQINGVSEVFNLNEVQVANGLKSSPSFIGQKSGGTETNMGIVFTKMLSQLKLVQKIVAANMQKGFLLELLLAGFDIKYIKVEFKTSTITDDLKLWQAKEIKQRTLHAMVVDGIIDQDQYAEEMGYDKAYSKKPLVPYEQQDGKPTTDSAAKKKREEGKDKSDRTGRDKKKDQPRRKDQSTKTR